VAYQDEETLKWRVGYFDPGALRYGGQTDGRREGEEINRQRSRGGRDTPPSANRELEPEVRWRMRGTKRRYPARATGSFICLPDDNFPTYFIYFQARFSLQKESLVSLSRAITSRGHVRQKSSVITTLLLKSSLPPPLPSPFAPFYFGRILGFGLLGPSHVHACELISFDMARHEQMKGNAICI
jgi:hypothetical protein